MKLSQHPTQNRKTRSKTSLIYAQTDAQSSYSQPFYVKEKKNKKKKIIKKNTSRENKTIPKTKLHERIYRFRLLRAKKTLRVYCYKESDLNWQPRFTNKLCSTIMDNDQDSDQQIVESQIENGRLRLLESIIQNKKQCKTKHQ